MARKMLALGIVLILAISLLSISMITCFTYDADADEQWDCEVANIECHIDPDTGQEICWILWRCVKRWHTH